MLQRCIFCFLFLKRSRLEMFFQKQDCYIWMKGEITCQLLITQTETAMKKIVLKQEEAWLQLQNFT